MTASRKSVLFAILTVVSTVGLTVALGGLAYGEASNQVSVGFDTAQRYNTDDNSVSNVDLKGFISLNANLHNQGDSTGEPVTGSGLEGGPELALKADSDASDVNRPYLETGSVPGTDFTWDYPELAENNAVGSWANLGDVSFTPGFAATRSADETVFDSTGGVQVLTLTVTPEEAIERLNFNGNSRPGGYGYFTAEITDVQWETAPPSGSLDFNENGFWGGISDAESGVTYTLIITTKVASTLAGVDVTYMPDIDLSNQHTVANSTEPESASSLVRATAGGTWTWAASGTYLWNWQETTSRAVHLNGHISGDANSVWAHFDTAKQYNTDGNSVSNTDLDGFLNPTVNLNNQGDSTGQPVTGSGPEGGPSLALEAISDAVDVNNEYLTTGSTPGTDFTWDFPALAENNGLGSWANLGDISFTPGFAVTRSADETVFGSAVGTQTLTLTITPEEAIERLNINGNARPWGGYEQYAAKIIDVAWVTEPPSGNLDFDENGFWAGVNNAEAYVTYSLVITTEVVSTLDGINVTYMPDLHISSQHTEATSSEPEVGSGLSRVTAGGTWTWTASGTYLWNWRESTSRAVHLNGYVGGDANLVGVNFDTSQSYETEGDDVANDSLVGFLNLSTNLGNDQDYSGQSLTGTGSQGGPLLALEAVSDAVDVNNEYLATGSTPGTDFTWDFPAVAENEGQGSWANLGEVTFTPGFSVTRSHSQVVFDTEGGTQTLTLVVTAQEDMEYLSINGNLGPWGDWPYYSAKVLSAAWEGTVPPDSDVSHEDGGFWANIRDVHTGSTYTLIVTTEVASTLEGADVRFRPDVEIRNGSMVAESTEPKVTDSLSRTTAGGTWTWTADGTCMWNWQEYENRVVHLVGRAETDGNVVWANFSTSRRYETEEDSVSNVSLDGLLDLGTDIWNERDGSGAPVLGSSEGPVLTLEAVSDAEDVNPDYLESGTIPGTDFAWEFPAVAEEDGQGSWANLGEVSFIPGFSVEREASQTVFDFSGGTQTLTITVTAEEDMPFLHIGGNIHTGDWPYYTADVVSVEWDGSPPPDSDTGFDDEGFYGDIWEAEEGSVYVLVVTTEVASTLAGDVSYLPDVEIRNDTQVGQSTEPEVSGSLTRVTSGGRWTWTAAGHYLWNWQENEGRVVCLLGHATTTANRVLAVVGSDRIYETDADSVSDAPVDGYTQLVGQLNNTADGSGASVTGIGPQGGPALELSSASTIAEVQEDYLSSGAVPGTDFSWEFPAVGQMETQGAWARLQAVQSFSPGFSVTRSADHTVFDSTGGTQVLTVTVTPEEPTTALIINGNARPEDSDYNATVISVEVVDAPEGAAIFPNHDAESFAVFIIGPQEDYAYTLRITTEVAATEGGVRVDYMPSLDINGRHLLAASSDPVVDTGLELVTAQGTYTWTTDTVCVWDWRKVQGNLVRLTGHAVVTPAPTISSVAPAIGPASGGNSVVITGTDFTNVSNVTFGTSTCYVYTVNSDTQITATAPGHAPGTVQVQVTAAGGPSDNTAADNYTYVAAPTVTGLAPTAGPASGGTSVTITGTDFTGATAVTFGGTAATGVSVNPAGTQITVNSPAHAAGTVQVQVTTPGGPSENTSADDFTYLATTRYDDKASKITYLPGWSRWDGSNYWAAYQDTYAYTDKKADKVLVTFEGTSLDLIACTSNTKGKAKVTVDPGTPGAATQTVDLYSSATLWKQKVYSTGTLTYGTHTVVIECLYEKRAASGWYTIDVDAFDIVGTLEQSPTVTKIDDNNYAYFAYAPGIATGASTSQWSRWDGSNYYAAYNDTYAYTDKVGYKTTFTFNGTYASWVACTSNTKGKALVTVDGDTANAKTVDLYSSTTLWKQKVYDTGILADGSHTVVIECLGTKNVKSWYHTIDVDRFDVMLSTP